MAAIGVALWRYVMRYAPHTPGYYNRDRFVLSNGIPFQLLYFMYQANQPRTHVLIPIRFSPFNWL